MTGSCNPDRDAEVFARFMAGATIGQLGRDLGLTRQRIDQVCARADRTLYRLECRRRRAHLRLVKAAAGHVHALERELDRGACRICGAPVVSNPPNATVCGGEHNRWLNALRYHVDPTYRQGFRLSVARWRVAHDGDPVQRHAAQRLLDGVADTEKGRWLVPGSAVWGMVVTAHREGWPVWDELPPAIQDQVRAAVAEGRA